MSNALFEIDYVGDVLPANSELIGKRLVTALGVFMSRANFLNLPVCEFCKRKLNASGFICPAFLDHVLRVVFESAKKQVVRIHAKRVVALVKHIHSFWNFTILKHPIKAVSADGFSLKPKATISALSLASLPFQTTSFRGFIWSKVKDEASNKCFIHFDMVGFFNDTFFRFIHGISCLSLAVSNASRIGEGVFILAAMQKGVK